MKSFIYFIIFCLLHANLLAQENTTVQVLENTNDYTIFDIQLGKIEKIETLPNQYKIVLKNATQLLDKGNPDLPKLSYSFALPTGTTSKAEILEQQYYEIQNILISPSKGNFKRTIKPSSVPYIYSSTFLNNTFFPTNIFTKTQAYTLRDVDAEVYHVYPTQYNAVSKTLRVYTHIKIKMVYSNNPSATIKDPIKPLEEYEAIYKNRFINYRQSNTSNKVSYAPISDQGALLILSPQEYISTLAPYIKWKEMKGIKTQLVNIDTLSGGVNYTTIKNCITTYNNTLHQAYILLVGDANKIPTYAGSVAGSSDQGYTYYTNDHYPDCIIGRFSAETNEDLLKQINKTILYEKNRNINGNWMQSQIGIASNEGGNGDGDDNQADWEHERDICDSNKNQYNYVQNYELYDGAHGGNDDSGNPDFTALKTAIDAGVSLVNYTGHGYIYNLVTTNTSTTDIQQLNNVAGKWPFFFIVGCETGNFTNATCLAEQLARNGSLNNETGAISSFMSTIDQYWEPPMQAQDEFNALLRGARSNTTKTTLGSMCVDACASMNDQYNTVTWPNDGNDMTDTWVFFGDPTVDLYTKNEGVITCSNISKIIQNTGQYSVNCNVEGATVGLYYQGKYLAHAKVVGGVAHFTFAPVTILDSVLITATKQNYVPFLGKTTVEVTGSVNVNNVDEKNTIFIYPNPTKNTIKITTDIAIKVVKIYNTLGEKLIETNVKSIQVSHLPSGVYYITTETDYGITRHKLVKE